MCVSTVFPGILHLFKKNPTQSLEKDPLYFPELLASYTHFAWAGLGGKDLSIIVSCLHTYLQYFITLTL